MNAATLFYGRIAALGGAAVFSLATGSHAAAAAFMVAASALILQAALAEDDP